MEIAKHRNPADPVAEGEEKQLRSVVGSSSWIARQARPDILYRVCRSLVANLNTEVSSRVQDKRLQIELDAIRQSIFDGDGRRTAEVYPKAGDRVDWVATAAQVADCLTEFWIHASTRSRARATPSPALALEAIKMKLYLRDSSVT